MSTIATVRHAATSNMERLSICGSAALTYAVALWLIIGNPFIAAQIYHPPITIVNMPYGPMIFLRYLLLIIGMTPFDCLIRIAIVALIIQTVNAFTADGPEIDMERYRPYVFWRALYRFLASCSGFLRGRDLDGPPTTSLTEYERVTIRYFFAKFIFLPMMVAMFFGNLQTLIAASWLPVGYQSFSSPYYISHVYILFFRTIILIDVAWFAVGCCMETSRFSPIKTVDPYAAGWLVTLCCYAPLVSLSGKYIVWGSPEFPIVLQAPTAAFFAIVGAVLYTIYVIADMCFGLKCGNLLYRGLVDKGPYRWIRHPMYASKNLAWCLFTIPAINFHVVGAVISLGAWHSIIPSIAANWMIIPPMLCWMTIYAMRGITEERYLLAFPEYQEYCKRVRYRFIPGVL